MEIGSQKLSRPLDCHEVCKTDEPFNRQLSVLSIAVTSWKVGRSSVPCASIAILKGCLFHKIVPSSYSRRPGGTGYFAYRIGFRSYWGTGESFAEGLLLYRGSSGGGRLHVLQG